MGYTQQDGSIQGIPTALYWRIGSQSSVTATEQFIRTNSEGKKLDKDGNVVPFVNCQYPADVEFGYDFKKIIKWCVVLNAYLSRSESDEFERTGKPPRDIKVFEFSEPKDSMAALDVSAIKGLYNHPLLQAQIPGDWISDEVQ